MRINSLGRLLWKLKIFAGLVLVLLAVLFRLRRHALAILFQLRRVRHRVRVARGLRITMPDGVALFGDHYYPVANGRYPTILIRSPYGHKIQDGVFGFLLTFFAWRFAERGYHVIVEDTRGRFDSQGEFDPYFNEKNDGLATLAWLEAQPWFDGQVGMWGPSYLGITQLAVAPHAPQIKALVPSITSSQLPMILFPDGAFDLSLALRWLGLFQLLDHQYEQSLLDIDAWREQARVVLKPAFRVVLWEAISRDGSENLLATAPMLQQVEQAIAPGFMHLPLVEADEVALGKPVAFYRRWLDHADARDELWQEARDTVRLADIEAPVHLIGGWYDFFLRAMLCDYAELAAAGRQPYLTIGPWHHFSNGMGMFDTLQDSLDWFDAHLKGQTSRRRESPVRIYIMGSHQWRDLPAWPPPAEEEHLFLAAGGKLQTILPANSQPPDHYRYDPADPTPALGGAQFTPSAGAFDNRRLEARDDVLVFTTPVLSAAVEVIGPVRLELYIKSSLEHTDFFGRLCDVHPGGRSINVCDGLFRITPGKGLPQADGSLRITIDMWATAHCFRQGHAIRLQVSSGAHPRWSRNLGSGEPIGTGTTLLVAEQTVFHDPPHPSMLILPVTAGNLATSEA